MAIIDGCIRCCDCREIKPLAAFSPSIVSRGCGRCRDCGRAAQRADRKRAPDRYRAYRTAFVARSPDSARASNKRWQEKKLAQYLAEGPSKENIRCSACGEMKPVIAYQPSVLARGSGTCRDCKYLAKRDYERRNPDKVNAARKANRDRNLERSRATARAWASKNRETFRRYNLGRYGITVADYDAMLASQGGGCACCGAKANRSGKRLFVDHNHETGAIRGLLCHHCNAGIGHLGDTIEGLRRALAYLEMAQLRTVRVVPAMRINLLPTAN